MPSIKNVRFQKLDDYDNPVFICNTSKEPKAHKKLKKYHLRLHQSLQKSNKNCFLPLYANDEHKYATIRLKKDSRINKLKLTANDVCDIRFTIRKKTVDGKNYVSCFCDEIQLISKAPPVNLGEEMTFDSDDSDDELSGDGLDMPKLVRVPKVPLTRPPSPTGCEATFPEGTDPFGGHSHEL